MSTLLNTDPSKVTASTGSNPGYAIDQTGVTIWYSTSTPAQWVKYDFTTGTLVTSTLFKPIDGYRIKDFKIQGSNNDADWTDLLSTQHPDSLTEISYNLSSTGSYRYYRFYISTKWGTGNVATTKWGLFVDAVNVTVSPSVLTSIITIQSPSIVIPVTVFPTLLTSTITLQSPMVGNLVTVYPTVLTSTISIQTPSYLISSTVLPSLLTSTISIQNPTFPGLLLLKNAVKIISYNPLVIIMNQSPLRIAKIDTTDPDNLISSVYEYSGVSTPTDVVYDSLLNKIYVSCANGRILEIDSLNFNNYTVYNTGISLNLIKIGNLNGQGLIHAASTYSLGEVVLMDDSTSSVVSCDLRWSSLVKQALGCIINTVNGKILNTDLRWSQQVNTKLGCDIRFNNVDLTEPYNAISRADFVVYINGVQCTDVKLDSIVIRHNDDEQSSASFVLARHHDNLDYTLDNVYSQITNNNEVKIFINGVQEFPKDGSLVGYISQIDAKSEEETVTITAYSADPAIDERSLVTLSLPSLNENLSIHHVIINNPIIDNPYVAVDEINPKIEKGIFVQGGTDEKQNISRWSPLLNTATTAESVQSGEFIPKQSWTYFWFAKATNFITGVNWATLRYLGTSPTSLNGDTWNVTGLSYKYQRQFDSDKTLLGTGIVYANDFKYVYTKDCQEIYDLLKPHGSISYNGTTIVNYENKPSVYSIMLAKLGFTVGSAPYKSVSCKSGRLVTSEKWEDNPDGLYAVKDESYDYRQYALDFATLEYQKLCNINGTVTPKTSGDIDMVIDGYQFYNIQLLKRINIDNTTKANIYNNQNGFPVSVKGIEINSSTMKVSLHCDNQWSRTEMKEIEASYPNEDDDKYLFPEVRQRLYTKFDPKKQGTIE